VIAGSQEPVIGIEQHELFLDRLTKTVNLAAIVKDEVQPLSNDCVHHDAEDGGGHNVPLVTPLVAGNATPKCPHCFAMTNCLSQTSKQKALREAYGHVKSIIRGRMNMQKVLKVAYGYANGVEGAVQASRRH
jgi:hypothetical protein